MNAGQTPEHLQAKHHWRTRPDPLADIWPQAEARLKEAPELEAKALFEHLQSQPPGRISEKHQRTFQRRVHLWRLQHGEDKEVFFPQAWEPGRPLQLDWTHASELAVTISGVPYPHWLCHTVLPYSNWQWATRCRSESLLSLRQGLQASLHRLGQAPQEVRVDHSSAATHRLGAQGGREFNAEFVSVCGHYGLVPKTIGIGCPNENGDVESGNGHLKRRLTQHLLLRGSRDFASEADYDRFLQRVLERANAGRADKLAEELAEAQAEGRSVIGPAARAPHNNGGRYTTEDFQIEVEQRKAICPAGKENTQCSRLEEQATGKVTYRLEWSTQCADCPLRERCVGPGQKHRSLVVGQHHSALQARRQEQKTEAFTQQMKHRNGIEGTQSELWSKTPRRFSNSRTALTM